MEPYEDMNDKSKPALSLVTPQARHHYTRFDQVGQLVGAEESDSQIAYMGRMMALCSLPRTDPVDQKEFKRSNGPYTLYMVAGGGNKLPFGNIPRLLLAWVCTEVVRTQSRRLFLGNSLSNFVRMVGIAEGGGARTRLRDQMERLFRCTISLIYRDTKGSSSVSSQIADVTEFWWAEDKNENLGWKSSVRLGEEFFNEIMRHPVPLDIHILKALTRSSLGLDLYLWINYRTFGLEQPLRADLASALPPVRIGTEQGERQTHCPKLQSRLCARAEEDQDRMGWARIRDTGGSPCASTLNHTFHSTSSISLAPPISLRHTTFTERLPSRGKEYRQQQPYRFVSNSY